MSDEDRIHDNPALARAHLWLDTALPRLGLLAGTDPAAFVLGVDALVEGLAVALDGSCRGLEFDIKLKALAAALQLKGNAAGLLVKACDALRPGRRLGSMYRHEFASLEATDALAGLTRLKQLLRALSYPMSRIAWLAEDADALFAQQTSPVDLRLELEKLRMREKLLGAGSSQLEDELRKLRGIDRELSAERARSRLLESEIDELRDRAQNRSARADELRRKLHEAGKRVKELESRRTGLSRAQEYRDYLARFTAFTRTRAAYEQSLQRLSAEQESILNQIAGSGDFLIRGPAGSGKTLILMYALRNALRDHREELSLSAQIPFRLFTYNKSLMRFTRYLAQIVSGLSDTSEVIVNYDRYLSDLLPEARIDFQGTLATEWFQAHSHEYDGLAEVGKEGFLAAVNELIYGHDLSEAEFVDGDGVVLPSSLRPAGPQRRALWYASRALAEEMEARSVYLRQYASLVLRRRAQADEEFRTQYGAQRVFVDEAQDLSPADLAVLKALSQRGVVLAGDEQQMIYRRSPNYARSGIQVRGRTRVIRENYRNTTEICALSEALRSVWNNHTASDELGRAHRPGPAPELSYVAPRDQPARLAARLPFFIESLGYAPENICVLVPRTYLIDEVMAELHASGIESVKVNSDDFDLEQEGRVRVSTLHSAKGLEFPVVFVLLSGLRGYPDLDEENSLRRNRNLIYVSITRAVDYLQVYMPPGPREQAVAELEQAFIRYAALEPERAGPA